MYVRYTHSSVVKFENFEPAFFEGNRNLNKPQPNSPYRIFFLFLFNIGLVAHDKPCYWGDKNQGWCEDCWTRIPLQRWFNFQTLVPPPLSHVQEGAGRTIHGTLLLPKLLAGKVRAVWVRIPEVTKIPFNSDLCVHDVE